MECVIPLANGVTSEAYTNAERTLVLKKVKLYTDWSVVDREIYWLKKTQRFQWSPKFVSRIEPHSIVMSYCGERLNKENLPKDWKKQADDIMNDLDSIGCRHNDIKSQEILVLDGKLKLIDFGWASARGDFSCSGQFDKREKPHGFFNDIYKIIAQYES